MRLSYRHLLITFFLIGIIRNYAQNTNGQPIQVIPSSPAATSIERYIDYPVSLYTGVPDITIPIYEIVSGDLTLPITISYHASGIKMKDFSYPVGLGWTLNTGGRISRTVRDKPDESYAPIAAILPNPTIHLKDAIQTMDLEPDIFSFSLGIKGGLSGKFLFDGLVRSQNNNQFVNPVFFPVNKNIKFSYNSGIINLIDPLGRSFKYEQTETNQFTGRPDSWLVTEIMPTSGQQADKITFQYVQGPKPTVCSYEGTMTIVDSITFSNGATMDPYLRHFDYLYGLLSGTGNYYVNPYSKLKRIDDDGNKMAYVSNYIPGSGPGANASSFYTQDCKTHDTKNLTSIYFKGGHVEFTYNSAKMLSQIKVFNSALLNIRTASFYYNITVDGAQRCLLDSVVIKGDATSEQRMVYKFGYHSYGMSTMYSARDFWGYYNGQDYNTTPIPRWTDVRTLALWKYDANNNPDPLYINTEIGTAETSTSVNHMKAYVLNKVTFPSGGYTEFDYEANQYLDESNVLKDVGGLRVKTIKIYDGVSAPLIKEYKYGVSMLNGAGVPRNVPTYDDFVIEKRQYHDHLAMYSPTHDRWHFPLSYVGVYARIRTFLSSPIKELSFGDGSSVWYTFVQETLKNQANESLGKTEYFFELPEEDTEDNYQYEGGADMSTLYQLIKRGFNFPMIKEKHIFKFENAGFTKIKSHIYTNTPFGNSGNLGEVYTFPYFLAQTYNDGVPSGELEADPFYNPEYGLRVAQANGEVRNQSYFPTSESITEYTIAGAIDQVISYTYNPTLNSAPVTISQTAGNKFIINRIKYPTDYTNLTATDNLTNGIKKLQDKNIYSIPVEEVTEVFDNLGNSKGVSAAKFFQFRSDNSFLDRSFHTETNKLIPGFSLSSVQNGAIAKSGYYKELTQIDAYNSEGDILEYHDLNNIHTVFLWGYNNIYPVAKIINTTHVIASTYVDQNILSNPSDETTLRSELNKLRSIPGAIVTTYTYKPLIGMTSETDVNNRTVYYEYDSFNRLSIVRDNEGKIIKKICYNYAGQAEECNTFYNEVRSGNFAKIIVRVGKVR